MERGVKKIRDGMEEKLKAEKMKERTKTKKEGEERKCG